MPLGPGSRLADYEIVRPLGAGGMGEVWLATELRLGRKVALKILPGNLTGDPTRVQRFEQEARAASGLSHPHVCTIYALGETSEGQHLHAGGAGEGDTLRQWLSRTGPAQVLPIRESPEIAIRCSGAMSAAHTAGIIHRDIKPENVMLRPDGFVKVLDFGLAKLAPTAPELAGADTWAVPFDRQSGRPAGRAVQVTRFDNPARGFPQEIALGPIGIGKGRLAVPVAELSGSVWTLDNADK